MLALDLLLTAGQASQPTEQDPYLQRFFLSPGAGGIAVFLAAAIAGFVAWRNANKTSTDAQAKAADERVKATAEQNFARARAGEERERVRQEQFWARLTWIYERATAQRPEARLSSVVTLALLDALGAEADTELEVTAIENLIIGLTVDRTGGGAEE